MTLEAVFAVLAQHGCRPKVCRAELLRAHCPAHDDRRPSLLVYYVGRRPRRRGFAYWRCLAGCPWQAVGAALGLKGPSPRAIVATAASEPLERAS